jgi:hypothetical protein
MTYEQPTVDVVATLEATIAGLRDERDALRELLIEWRATGCHICGGDCGAANPPVDACLMHRTCAAIDAARKQP